MRLIDADALDEVVLDLNTNRGFGITRCDYKMIDAVLFEFPTIEERKKGRWIEIGTITHSYKCSVCGRMLVNITDGKNKVAEHYPFCHCGARMVQEGEEHEPHAR